MRLVPMPIAAMRQWLPILPSNWWQSAAPRVKSCQIRQCDMEKTASILVITCSAVAREVNEIKKLGAWAQMDLQSITADLHATPGKIPQAVADKIDKARDSYEHIFVAYGIVVPVESSTRCWKREV
jgi:hypothetical protein